MTDDDVFHLTVQVDPVVPAFSPRQQAAEPARAPLAPAERGDEGVVREALQRLQAFADEAPPALPQRAVALDLVEDSAGMTYWDHWAAARGYGAERPFAVRPDADELTGA